MVANIFFQRIMITSSIIEYNLILFIQNVDFFPGRSNSTTFTVSCSHLFMLVRQMILPRFFTAWPALSILQSCCAVGSRRLLMAADRPCSTENPSSFFLGGPTWASFVKIVWKLANIKLNYNFKNRTPFSINETTTSKWVTQNRLFHLQHQLEIYNTKECFPI